MGGPPDFFFFFFFWYFFRRNFYHLGIFFFFSKMSGNFQPYTDDYVRNVGSQPTQVTYDLDYYSVRIPVSSLGFLGGDVGLTSSALKPDMIRDTRANKGYAQLSFQPCLILVKEAKIPAVRLQLRNYKIAWSPDDRCFSNVGPAGLLLNGTVWVAPDILAKVLVAAGVDHVFIYRYGCKYLFNPSRLDKLDISSPLKRLYFLTNYEKNHHVADNQFDIAVSIPCPGVPFIRKPLGLKLASRHGVDFKDVPMKMGDSLGKPSRGRANGTITVSREDGSKEEIPFKIYSSPIHIVKSVHSQNMKIPVKFRGLEGFEKVVGDMVRCLTTQSRPSELCQARVEITVTASTARDAFSKAQRYLSLGYWTDMGLVFDFLPIQDYRDRLEAVWTWCQSHKLFSGGRYETEIPKSQRQVCAEVLDTIGIQLHEVKLLATLSKGLPPSAVWAVWEDALKSARVKMPAEPKEVSDQDNLKLTAYDEAIDMCVCLKPRLQSQAEAWTLTVGRSVWTSYFGKGLDIEDDKKALLVEMVQAVRLWRQTEFLTSGKLLDWKTYFYCYPESERVDRADVMEMFPSSTDFGASDELTIGEDPVTNVVAHNNWLDQLFAVKQGGVEEIGEAYDPEVAETQVQEHLLGQAPPAPTMNPAVSASHPAVPQPTKRPRRESKANEKLVLEGLACFKSFEWDLNKITLGSWVKWCTANNITSPEGLNTTYKALLKKQGHLKDFKLPEVSLTESFKPEAAPTEPPRKKSRKEETELESANTYAQGEVAAGRQSTIQVFFKPRE